MDPLDRDIEEAEAYLYKLVREREERRNLAERARFATALAVAGTIAGAARIIGVTRRVAGRMLRNYGFPSPRGRHRTRDLVGEKLAREMVAELGLHEAARRLGVNYKTLGRLVK